MPNENIEVLPVLVCSQPPVIVQNLVDLRTKIDANMQLIHSLPQTSENLATVKAIRADMRKTFDHLEAQRKTVKAEIMEPYERANAAYQQLVAAPMKEADDLCKFFVDQTQMRIKQTCEQELREFFRESAVAHNLPWLNFERCGIKIDMAMAQKKDWAKERQQITDFVQRVGSEVQTISEMEYAADIMSHYIRTLDFSVSVGRVNEQNRLRADAEAIAAATRQRNQAQQEHVRELGQQVPDAAPVLVPHEKKVECTFTVRATVPMLRGLKIYLQNNKFEIVEDNNE